MLSLEELPNSAGLLPPLIFCPFAGASASAFGPWRSLRDSGFQVTLTTYPGHDHRMNEPPCSSIEMLADQITDEILASPYRYQQPFILGGHSMGAQIAFETCRRLELKSAPPACLLLSGCQAPHLRSRRQLRHLNDSLFVAELFAIGGCDASLIDNPTLLAPFLPMLRSDFTATETYHRALEDGNESLKTPTLLMYGTQDSEATFEEVSAWLFWVGLESQVVEIPGDHFSIVQRPRALLRRLSEFYHAVTDCP